MFVDADRTSISLEIFEKRNERRKFVADANRSLEIIVNDNGRQDFITDTNRSLEIVVSDKEILEILQISFSSPNIGSSIWTLKSQPQSD